jgi:hypothetical protein
MSQYVLECLCVDELYKRLKTIAAQCASRMTRKNSVTQVIVPHLLCSSPLTILSHMVLVLSIVPSDNGHVTYCIMTDV